MIRAESPGLRLYADPRIERYSGRNAAARLHDAQTPDRRGRPSVADIPLAQLQRLVGNRAVTRLVRASEPVRVQRCGDHPCEGVCTGKEPEQPATLTHVVQLAHAAGTANPARAHIAGPELDVAEQQAQRPGAEIGAQEVTVIAAGGIQREKLGTKFTHPTGAKSAFKKITANFDGAQFTTFGDGKQIMQVNAQSGRPYTVRPADAKACGGDKDDSYLNNPRYVGISDNGPIPEGTYQFSASQTATFSAMEQLKMLPGGSYVDPFGVSLHGGDWGSGRAPLTPLSIVAGSKGCGNTKTRSGFFLHGGIMPGSSGCIDIGNSGVDELVKLLSGYTGKVIVTVKYTAKAPSVGPVERATGRFTYPKKKDPSLWDRIKAAAGVED